MRSQSASISSRKINSDPWGVRKKGSHRERQRERERERERHTHTHTERQTGRQTDRQTDTERECVCVCVCVCVRVCVSGSSHPTHSHTTHIIVVKAEEGDEVVVRNDPARLQVAQQRAPLVLLPRPVGYELHCHVAREARHVGAVHGPKLALAEDGAGWQRQLGGIELALLRGLVVAMGGTRSWHRERERERERERGGGGTHRHTDTHTRTHAHKHRRTHPQTHTNTHTHTYTRTDIHTHTQKV